MQPHAARTDGSDSPRSCPAPRSISSEPLVTVRLSDQHRIQDFKCSASPRVANFFVAEGQKLIQNNYCRAFVYPHRDDPAMIAGYYTLSAALIKRSEMKNADNKRSADISMVPAPAVRIGFMGRDDRAPKGLGAGLVTDAARRIYQNEDVAAWAIVLEPEGGKANKKLWEWYGLLGFRECRIEKWPDKAFNEKGHEIKLPFVSTAESVYAPLSALIPELSDR